MKKTIITIVSLIVLLVVVLYGYEFIFKKPVIDPVADEAEMIPEQSLDVKVQYKDSRHTFVGTLSVPTPCHTLVSDVTMTAPGAYQIEVNTVAPVAGVMCAQVITDKDFKVSFEAPEDAIVTAFIDGVEYSLNRFMIPEGENIDTFELMIKG